MTGRNVFTRKKYLIKKGFQFRYIGIVFALAILASIVTGYTVFATGWTLLGEKLANVYPQGRAIYVLKATNMALIRNLLFISPIVFILGLLFSHKIAGPVYRIEKSLYEISNGNLALKIKLRRGDELWDLADIINTMIEELNKTIGSDKKAMLEIQLELDKIKREISTQPLNPAAIASSVDNLEAKIKQAQSSLNNWTTA